MSKLSYTDIKAASDKLNSIATILKNEFFGLDEIIDKIINYIKPWYICPELLARPVIINLWGMTGVGKTALVRRLVELLGFYDRFVEVQMDGIGSSGNTRSNTIANELMSSSIKERQPGILLLDEFQRYRTIDNYGKDIANDKYADVWALLSDGKFPADSSALKDMELLLAFHIADKNSTGYSLRHYADKIIKLLKLDSSIIDVMMMDPEQIAELVKQAIKDRQNEPIDYTKLLIFISGNLDEVYHMASSTYDCDTDADVYYNITKNININNIKTALSYRFKPEQIARLGNNHIIYTSLSRKTYEDIIHTTCNDYINKLYENTGIKFTINNNLYNIIYNNAVYPSQGTRPVFTSIHKIFNCPSLEVVMWAIENNIDNVQLSIDKDKSVLVATNLDSSKEIQIKIELDINNIREKRTEDYNTILAVHEAGHAIVYALLFNKAPQEVKINGTSTPGYVMFAQEYENKKHNNKQDYINYISTYYAGRCAEEIVFGNDFISSGARYDIKLATDLAVQYTRVFAMGTIPGLSSNKSDTYTLCVAEKDDKEIKELLTNCRDKAFKILKDNKQYFIRLVNKLLENKSLTQQEFIDLFPEFNLKNEDMYVTLWDRFKSTQ